MTKMSWSWLGALCGVWSAGCSADVEKVSATGQAIYGAEGDYEFALDAPWRIEPTMPGLDYGTIPITISIHDAHLKGDLDDHAPYEISTGGVVLARGDYALGRVKALRITEVGVGTFDIPLDDLHEVERTVGAWPFPNGPAPTHELCRAWVTGSCASSPLMIVSDASEWHATYFYTPRGPRTPGRDIRLDLALTVSQVNRHEAQYPGVYSFDDVVLSNQLVVRLGEAPLPRFDDATWAYGDLHYHSQGTDNEGESAYGYRSVLHAMAALGLDFALAAEHASDSKQMVDLDLPPDAIFNERFSGLRDMSDQRYGHLWHWLQNADGANREGRSFPRLVSPNRQRVPQIFLGGEVDVVPETPAGSYVIPYGNGKHYDIMSACARRPVYVPFAMPQCDSSSIRQVTDDGRWIVRDPQSLDIAAARQHLLYLPRSATGNAGFISGETTKYGGGRFRLKDLVRNQFDLNDQGDFFLAHPNDASDESGFASLGPDIVPYSQAQYDDIFGSKHFLGLQLWNSDARRSIDADFGVNRLIAWSGQEIAWDKAPDQPGLFDTLHHGAATWDRLLLAGMDPARTSQVPWLAPGEPRKFFMAGGSDAHGDLNFRRKGYMAALEYYREDIDDLSDTAMGTPRNLVHAGIPAGNALVPGIESRPFTQDQIFGALARGEFAVTDGPALRLVWDVNESGTVDDSDVPMGGAITYDPQVGPPSLLVEWKSTVEFGEVDKIELYVGAAAGSRGLVYAPANHGVRKVSDEAPDTRAGNPLPAGFRDEVAGQTVFALDDGYWQNENLKIDPSNNRMAGFARIKLRPSEFRVGGKGTRVCKTTPLGKRDCFYRFDNPVDPTQFYVRAFAMTRGRAPAGQACADTIMQWQRLEGRCIPRLAFTNPVWARPAHPMRASTIVASNGKCLDVLGGNLANGAPVGIWSCNGSGMQRWIYDNTAKTLSGWGQKLLDALGWQTHEGAAVAMWEPDGAWNQQWTFNGVEIRGIDGKNLDVGGVGEGASTLLATGNGSAHQKWTFTAAGEVRSSDNRCLDVYGHWTHEGAPVMLYNCYGTANQKWKLLPGGMLQGTESGKCLAPQADSATDGTPLVLASCTQAPARRWSLRGEIRAWNDKCLDVYGSQDHDGNSVLLYTCHGGANQRFTFYP